MAPVSKTAMNTNACALRDPLESTVKVIIHYVLHSCFNISFKKKQVGPGFRIRLINITNNNYCKKVHVSNANSYDLVISSMLAV